MKSINSLIKWIFFVPVFVMSLVIALFNGFTSGSVAGILGTNQNGLAQIITFAVLGLFAACFVASLFDRKTSPVHLLRKNIFCGVTSVGAALAMAAHAAFDVTNIINSPDSVSFMSVITILFTGVAGVTMLYLGLNHFLGKNSSNKLAILYLSLPLWCASHLIDRFLKNTATPVAAAESLDLVMFVALALFFMNVAMIHSVINLKNSVKSTINYGLPAVVIAFVYSINQIFAVANSETFIFLDMVPAIAYIFIGLYTMGFVAELSFKAKTVDEQIILETEEETDTTFSDEYYNEAEEETTVEEPAYEDIAVEEQSVLDHTPAEEFVPATVSEEKITFFEEEDDDEEYYSEENITFDDDIASEPEAAQEPAPISPFIGAIRTVEDDEEEEVTEAEEITSDEPAEENIPEAVDDSESNVANELFKAAQQRDSKTDKNKKVDPVKEEKPEVSKPAEPVKAVKDEEKPKGPTTREAIMYEEEDFILTVQNMDTIEDSEIKNEEVSTFILDDQETDDIIVTKKSYEERLDEIDRLIISIQGGEEPEKK